MNRAERRQQQRKEAKEAGSNMERFRKNAERMKAGGSSAPAPSGDLNGIPLGVPFQTNAGLLPPFVPTQQCLLINLEVGNGTNLFALNLASPYGGGVFYFPADQFRKLIEQGTAELQKAATGLTIVGSEAEMEAIAERAQKMSSGLIVPGQ